MSDISLQQRVEELEAEVAHERHEKETVAAVAAAHAKWTRNCIAELRHELAQLQEIKFRMKGPEK